MAVEVPKMKRFLGEGSTGVKKSIQLPTKKERKCVSKRERRSFQENVDSHVVRVGVKRREREG